MQRMGWTHPDTAGENRRVQGASRKRLARGVLEKIRQCNIRNYSIFLREPENLLFGYFEYHGNDFEADMARMDRDEETRRWWKLTDPCQEGLETRAEGGVVGGHGGGISL